MQSPTLGHARFFERSGPFRLAEIASVAGGAIASGHDRVFDGIAPLQSAGPGQISFLDNRRYASLLDVTRAGAVIVHPDMQSRVPASTIAIVTAEPYSAWARVAKLFHPVKATSPGIHASAVVDDDAAIDPSADIGPLCVIEAGAVVGPRSRIGPGAVIGSGVVVGRDCRIGAHASLSHALLGDRVYIYPGARIGQEGFGFAVTKTGFLTVPQLGRVVIEDDVEIGANSTVDRGSAGDTVIGAGSRLDNLVQIGHNVVLGRCCIIVAMCSFIEEMVCSGW
ncbi:MAG: UDP-3-O-(3-hydroxymyristoyl)glucosamine N-acyltransferase [Pseudorhodoplanes sp.]